MQNKAFSNQEIFIANLLYLSIGNQSCVWNIMGDCAGEQTTGDSVALLLIKDRGTPSAQCECVCLRLGPRGGVKWELPTLPPWLSSENKPQSTLQPQPSQPEKRVRKESVKEVILFKWVAELLLKMAVL